MGEGVDTMFHTLDRYLEEGYIEKYPNVIIYTPDHSSDLPDFCGSYL